MLYILQLESMEPSLEELQHLRSQLAEHATLKPSDVALLDRSHNVMSSKEVANEVSQIYRTISQSTCEQYFDCLEAIAKNSTQPQTLYNFLSVMNLLMRSEWSRGCLGLPQLQAIINARQNKSPRPQSFLLLAQSLKQLWEEVIDNIGVKIWAIRNQGINNQIKHLVFVRWIDQANVLKSLYRPNTTEADSLKEEISLQLLLQCQWLQNNEADQHASLDNILRILKLQISSDQLMFRLLSNIINSKELRYFCLLFFQNKQQKNITLCYIHTIIAVNIFKIITQSLGEYENIHGVKFSPLSDATSTSKAKTGLKLEPDSLNLLEVIYHFLNRYEPFVDNPQSQESQRVDHLTNVKLYFYNIFSQSYGKIFQFLIHITNHFDNILKQVKDDKDSFEVKRQVICCAGLMLKIDRKQNNKMARKVKRLIQVCIVHLAPSDIELLPYFVEKLILRNGNKILVENPLVSAELNEEFVKFIQIILKEDDTRRDFVSMIQKYLGYIDVKFMEEEMKKTLEEMGKDIKLYQERIAVNVINRMSWCIAYAFRCNPKAIKRISILDLSQALSHKANKLPSFLELQRCCSLNSKLILQVYYPDNNNFPAIMKALRISHDQEAQFLLVILSKIFITKDAHLNIEFTELKSIIQRLRALEAGNPRKEKIIQLYPATVKLLVGKMKQLEYYQSSVNGILDIMINSNDMKNLNEFSQNLDTSYQKKLRLTIYLFKKLKEIGYFLSQEFQLGTLPHNIVNWACNTIHTVIVKFLFKYQLFGQHLSQTDEDEAYILHLIEFRKHYLELLHCYIALTTAAACSERDLHALRQNQDWFKIAQMEQRIRKDFIKQTQFKQKDYLLFALKFYKWALLISVVDSCDELINDSISAIVECLRKWERDSGVQKEKYVFWKEVVRIFALKLNRKNKEHLVRLFADLKLKNIQNDSVEAILDVFQQLIEILHEQCIKDGSPHECPELTNLLITTFETLCSSSAKHNMSTFDRLTQLLFCQINFLASLPNPLESDSIQDSSQTALIQHLPHQDSEKPLKKRSKREQLEEKKDRKKSKNAGDTDWE